MANVTVIGTGTPNIEAGNRTSVRTSGDRVYVLHTDATPTLHMRKGNVTGEPASFVSAGSLGTVTGLQNIGGACAIDSNDIIHCIYYVVGPGMNDTKEITYVTFDTSTDTFGTPEAVATLDNDLSTHQYLAIAIDANNKPHVIWRDALTEMGNTTVTCWYSNKTGASWRTRVSVDGGLGTSQRTRPYDILIGEPTSSIGADRPICLVQDPGNLQTINAFYGDALDATSFTEASDITGAITTATSSDASFAIDSNGKITVAFSQNTSNDLMVVEHLASSAWSTWETPADVDTSVDYLSPSIAIIGTNRYIFVEDSTNSDLNLWMDEGSGWTEETADADLPNVGTFNDVKVKWANYPKKVNSYIFNGTVTDNGNEWTNDANIADGSESTSASSSLTGTDWIEINGTNAPSSGDTIRKVTLAILGNDDGASNAGRAEIRDGGTLLGSTITFDYNNTKSWYYLGEITAPAGGWTWAKLQGLECRLWEIGTNTQIDVFMAKIFVESEASQIGSSELDYVFEDSSGNVLYNTISKGGATQVTKTFTIDSVHKKVQTKTFTIDSVHLKTQTKTFTIDSVHSNQLTKTFTIDSVHQIVGTKTFTIDTVHLKALTKTFTIDSVHLVSGKTKTFTIDSVHLKVFTKTFTIDTVHLKALTKTFTIDSVHLKTQTKTFTIDTVHLKLFTKTFTIDSVHSNQLTKTFTIDSVHLKTQTKTFTIDTVHLKQLTKTFTIDTVHLKLFTKTFTIDSVHSNQLTKTFTIDTVHLRVYTKTFTIDSVHLVLGKTFTFTIDSVHLKQLTKTFTIDSVHSRLFTKTFTIDTVHQITGTKTFTIDSVHLKAQTKTFTIDTVHLVLGKTKTFTIDTVHQLIATKTFTIDSVHLKAQTKTFTIDSVHALPAGFKTFTIDSVHLKQFTKTFTIDSVHQSVFTKTFTIDTVHSIQATKTFTIDSVHLKQQTKTFTIDSVHNKTSKTFTIDSVHVVVVVQNINTPAGVVGAPLNKIVQKKPVTIRETNVIVSNLRIRQLGTIEIILSDLLKSQSVLQQSKSPVKPVIKWTSRESGVIESILTIHEQGILRNEMTKDQKMAWLSHLMATLNLLDE